MTNYNFFENVLDLITSVLKLDLSISDSMKEVINYCKKNITHDDWGKFLDLHYSDITGMSVWLNNVIGSESLDKNLKALWFGIFNYDDDRNTTPILMYFLF